MRGAPTTQSPAIEARRSRPLAQCFLGNQRRQHERSLRRRSPVRMCESRRCLNHALAETGERQTDSSFGGKFSLEPNFAIGARNSAEFSKPKILRPDREFESHLVRQLVCCFCRENRVAGIIAKCPQVSSGEIAISDRRERSWVFTRALQARNSPFGNSAVRLGRTEHAIVASASLTPWRQASLVRSAWKADLFLIVTAAPSNVLPPTEGGDHEAACGPKPNGAAG